MRIWLLLVLLFTAGCQPWATEEEEKPADRPEVPEASVNTPDEPRPSVVEDKNLTSLPLPRNSKEAEQHFADVLNHPWVKSQPAVPMVTRVMVDDIRLLEIAHRTLNDQRKKVGQDTSSLQEESELIIQSLESLQKPLYMLGLSYPPELYNVLNIPATNPDFLPAPLPFQVYKRVHWFTAKNGFPVFLDLRMFPLAALKDPSDHDRTVVQIVDWHLDLLKGGRQNFVGYASSDCIAFVGSGDHDTNHLNPTHGMAATNRTLMVGFLEHSNKFYVLYAEGPRQEMQDYEQPFLKILNRPLSKIPSTSK